MIYDFGLWAKKFENCWFRRYDGLQSWTAHFCKEEDFCPIKNQTLLFQLVVSHLTEVFLEYRFVFHCVLSRYLVAKCVKVKARGNIWTQQELTCNKNVQRDAESNYGPNEKR